MFQCKQEFATVMPVSVEVTVMQPTRGRLSGVM